MKHACEGIPYLYFYHSSLTPCLVLSSQDQWCQPSHTKDSAAASTASDQQWGVCQAPQGLHQHAEAGGPLHCMGVRMEVDLWEKCYLPQFHSVRGYYTEVVFSTFHLKVWFVVKNSLVLRLLPVQNERWHGRWVYVAETTDRQWKAVHYYLARLKLLVWYFKLASTVAPSFMLHDVSFKWFRRQSPCQYWQHWLLLTMSVRSLWKASGSKDPGFQSH